MPKIVYLATRASSIPRDDAIDGAQQVVVIGPAATPVSAANRLVVADVPELGPLTHKLVDALWRSAPGRTLVRISTFDRSRRFWRSVREQRAAVADSLKGADVIVAADRDALWAAWQLARKTRGPAVVYGVSAAKFALNRE